MKTLMLILVLFSVFFILGCSENKELTSPQAAINPAEDWYIYISPDAEDPPFNAMPFDGECVVYKSDDGINWSALVPFSWEYGSTNSGKYDLWSDTYYKWRGSNLGEPNDWETTTRWYSFHQVGNPSADTYQTCMFYKD